MASVQRLLAAIRVLEEISQRFRASGTRVAYRHCFLVPKESRCIALFEADSAKLVREVNEEARVPFLRILDAIDVTSSSAE